MSKDWLEFAEEKSRERWKIHIGRDLISRGKIKSVSYGMAQGGFEQIKPSVFKVNAWLLDQGSEWWDGYQCKCRVFLFQNSLIQGWANGFKCLNQSKSRLISFKYWRPFGSLIWRAFSGCLDLRNWSNKLRDKGWILKLKEREENWLQSFSLYLSSSNKFEHNSRLLWFISMSMMLDSTGEMGRWNVHVQFASDVHGANLNCQRMKMRRGKSLILNAEIKEWVDILMRDFS